MRSPGAFNSGPMPGAGGNMAVECGKLIATPQLVTTVRTLGQIGARGKCNGRGGRQSSLPVSPGWAMTERIIVRQTAAQPVSCGGYPLWSDRHIGRGSRQKRNLDERFVQTA